MEWETPKTDWTDSDLVTRLDFQRIEKNIEYLKYLVR
jgi:hypothetical protein